jgi:hypothetical protein
VQENRRKYAHKMLVKLTQVCFSDSTGLGLHFSIRQETIRNIRMSLTPSKKRSKSPELRSGFVTLVKHYIKNLMIMFSIFIIFGLAKSNPVHLPEGW